MAMAIEETDPALGIISLILKVSVVVENCTYLADVPRKM